MTSPTKIQLKKYNFNNAGSKRFLNKFLFSEIAHKYNLATKILSFGKDLSWKKKLVKKLPIKTGLKILDLACGTGDITSLLAKKFKDADITGIDLSGNMIKIAKEKLKYKNVTYIEKDMLENGFNGEIFDIITGGYAIRNAPDIKEALDEIYRLLKTGGIACFLEFSKSSNVILQYIQLFFLKIWGAFCGILLHGNPDVYVYISKSLKHFPDNKKLILMMKESGFINIKMNFLLFGFLYILSAEK